MQRDGEQTELRPQSPWLYIRSETMARTPTTSVSPGLEYLMKHFLGLSTASCLAALLCAPVQGSPIESNSFSIAPSTVSASAGDVGDAFDVLLTNNGSFDISVAAFAFEVTVADTDVTLTGADFSTTAAPYIFAGDSFDQNNSLTLDTPEASIARRRRSRLAILPTI
jgi:hypothetical protein